MPFLTQGKTNWKYILIIVILAILVGGGILGYCWRLKQEAKISEVKLPEKEISKKEVCFLKAKLEEYVPLEKKYQEIQVDESLKEAIIQQTIQCMIEDTQRIFKAMKFPELSFSSLRKRFCRAGIARITLGTQKIDVNEDGISEYVVHLGYVYFDKPLEWWWSGEIDHFMCVGANWAHFYIFGLKEGKWRMIGDLGTGVNVRLLKKQTKGYHNLVTWPHLPPFATFCEGAPITLEEFVWNGEKYELAKSTTFPICEKKSMRRSEKIPEDYLELIPEDFCKSIPEDICLP